MRLVFLVFVLNIFSVNCQNICNEMILQEGWMRSDYILNFPKHNYITIYSDNVNAEVYAFFSGEITFVDSNRISIESDSCKISYQFVSISTGDVKKGMKITQGAKIGNIHTSMNFIRVNISCKKEERTVELLDKYGFENNSCPNSE